MEEIIRDYSFALELGEDDIVRINNLITDNLDADSDYETIIEVLDDYNDGTTNFDDMCTDIYLELTNGGNE